MCTLQVVNIECGVCETGCEQYRFTGSELIMKSGDNVKMAVSVELGVSGRPTEAARGLSAGSGLNLVAGRVGAEPCGLSPRRFQPPAPPGNQ